MVNAGCYAASWVSKFEDEETGWTKEQWSAVPNAEDSSGGDEDRELAIGSSLACGGGWRRAVSTVWWGNVCLELAQEAMEREIRAPRYGQLFRRLPRTKIGQHWGEKLGEGEGRDIRRTARGREGAGGGSRTDLCRFAVGPPLG